MPEKWPYKISLLFSKYSHYLCTIVQSGILLGLAILPGIKEDWGYILLKDNLPAARNIFPGVSGGVSILFLFGNGQRVQAKAGFS